MPPELKDLDNLVKAGIVKPIDRDENVIRQYLANAQGFLDDARPLTRAQTRFVLAYEGIHAVAMAVLNHFGSRPGDGGGHRSQALQIVVSELKLEDKKKGSFKTITDIHSLRNEKTYRQPIPPVTDSMANATVTALELMIAEASALVGLPK